jgi:gliding motility-associated-like protein
VTVSYSSSATSGNLSVTATNGCGTSAARTLAITVNPLPLQPAAFTTSTTTVCHGATNVAYTVPNDATVTYNWSYSGTGATITGTGNSVTVSYSSSATSGNLSVTATNGCGTSAARTLPITVNPLPLQPATFTTSTTTLCQGTSNVTYTVPNDETVTYNWSYSGTGATITGTGNSVTVSYSSSATSGNLSVTATNGCGTSAAQTLPITVNPLPLQPAAFTTSTTTLCQGTSNVAYTVPNDATVTYNWSYSGTGATITGTGNSVTVSYSSSATSGNLSVTATNGCGTSAARTITITINPTPVVADQTTSIQTGNTFFVTPSGVPSGTNYTWTAPAETGTVSGGSAQTVPQSNISGFLTGVGTAIYNVTPQTGSCIGDIFTVTVTVTSTCQAVTILTNPADDSMCTNSGTAIFTVLAGNTAPFTYQWKYFNGSTWVNVSNGVPAGAVYENANTASLSVTGITTAGNYQYQCYITNCGGASDATSASAILTVNAPPSAPQVGDITQPACFTSTGSVVLSGLPATGTWTLFRTPGSVITTGTGTSTTISSLPAGTTYTYTVTDGTTLCTSVPSANVVINTQPLIPAAPVVGTITPPTCTVPTGSVVLAGLPEDGNWTLTRYPFAITTTGSGASVTITELATGSYNYTVANARGCVSPLSATVVIPGVPPNPTAPVIGTVTQPTCSDATGSVELSGLPAGNWVINPGAISGSGSGTTISGLSAGTYSFTVTNSGACTSLPSANVVIDAQPPTPVVTNQAVTISSGGTFTVTPSGVPGNTTYTWLAPTYTGGVTGGSAQTVPQSNITGSLTISTGTGTAIYTVTPVSGSCTGATFIVTVTVTSSCVPVSIGAQPDDDSMCAASGSASFTVVANGSSPFTYQWQYNNGVTWTNVVNGTPSGSTYTNSNTATLGITGITSAGTYLYRCFITNCSSSTDATSDAASLTVSPVPLADAGSGGNECDLDFVLSATPSIGTGTWTLTSGEGTAVFAPDANTPDATVTVSEYGVYNFTWTEISNGCSAGETITVSFYEQPVADAGTGGAYCGTEFSLNATLVTGAGTWTQTDGPGTSVFSPGVNDPDASVTVSESGQYDFTWTVVNGTCSDSETITVNFLEIPDADAGSDAEACGPEYTLQAVPFTGSVAGAWSVLAGPGNATFSPDAGNPDAKVTVDQAGVYDFIWTESNGTCQARDTVQIVFRTLPLVSAGNDTAICISYNIKLQGEGTGSFSWEPAALIINPETQNPVAAPLSTTEFILTLTDQYGCENSDTVLVEVFDFPAAYAGPDMVLEYLFELTLDADEPGLNETGAWSLISGYGVFSDTTDAKSVIRNLSLGENILQWSVSNGVCPPATDYLKIETNDLVIPTLITPNGDPNNEYFILNGLETLGKTELVIFDRRGAQVYKNTAYDNSWNGVDYNGNPLLDDTYYFVIKAGNGKSMSGYVVVRR